MKFWICGLILSWIAMPWIAMPWIAMTSAGHTQELSITEQTAFSFYKALELLTPSPIVVSPELAVKCTTPSAAELAADEQRAGPHSNAFVNLYVNEIAKQAIAERVGLFPAGAVIVKEKLERDVSAAAVGGMVKRSAGFDPDHGDWEYFYATKSGGFASGRLSTCVGCHAQAKARDYVFYVRPRL